MNTIERAQQRERQKALDNAAKEEKLSAETPLPTETKTAEVKAESVKTSQPVQQEQTADIGQEGFFELNLQRLDERGFVSVNSQRKLINEEFRAIKRKLLNNAFGAISKTLTNSNIIIVTSSKPGEGKTFTAVNLALSIALEQDKTVLLVDADVLKPNVSKTLEVPEHDGLMEFLLGEKDNIAEVLYKTNVDKLRVIPAGRTHHLSAELLASEKMLNIVNEFATRYNDRIVIVDAPPLLGINETAILANLAGQAVIVTEEGRTKLTDIDKAVSQLNPEMAIGFVVNKSQNANNEDHGYGYYYAGAN